jgi:hypothetical protein
MRITGKEAKDGTMVIGAARGRRRKWRRGKPERKRQKAAKDSGPKTLKPDEALRCDQPDTLLLSALKYWEVERDLIEERLDARRSAPATS